MEHYRNDTDRDKTEALREETQPSAPLSTTSLTRTDLTLSLGLCDDRPGTNSLSHGKVIYCIVWGHLMDKTGTDHFKLFTQIQFVYLNYIPQ